MKRKWMITGILLFGIIITASGTSVKSTSNEKPSSSKVVREKEDDGGSGNQNRGNSENGEKVIVIPNPKEEPTAEKEGEDAPKSEDTGTAPATQSDDVSDGSKFKTYNNYENAALAKRNPNTIYQLSQLYFKDGLYERAVNLSKKDVSGDIRNLFVVAIGSRLMGNYDQSIDYYNRILSVSPNNAEAKLGIGISYKAKQDFNKALGYFRDYSRTNSNSEVIREIAILNELVSNK